MTQTKTNQILEAILVVFTLIISIFLFTFSLGCLGLVFYKIITNQLRQHGMF